MAQEGMSPARQGSATSKCGSINQPTHLRNNKPQTRVFSKKAKSISQGPVPIPPSRNRSALDASRRSPDRPTESWEMSPTRRANSDSPESPTSVPEWCLSAEFDDDDSGHDGQSCSYLKPLESPASDQPGMFPFTEEHPGSPEARTGDLTHFPDRGDSGRSRGFDSGVGDSESEMASSRRGRTTSDSPSWTSASSSYPRLSIMTTHYEQHYEDIDNYKKYARPDGNGSKEVRRPVNGVLPHGGSQIQRMNISGVTNGESRDHVTPTATTQQNCAPLTRPYNDARTATLPHTYSHLETNGYTVAPKTVKKDGTRIWCCCLVLALIIIFIMSAAALSLGIYLILNDDSASPISTAKSESTILKNNTGLAQSVDILEGIIVDLQKDVEFLQQQNSNLKNELNQINVFVRDEVQPLYKEVSLLRIAQRDTVQVMSAMDDRLTSGITNISLTPGPQGPVGVADFSLCVFRSSTQSAAASTRYTTETPYLPSNTEAEDYVLLFAYCSMKGAQTNELEVKRAVKDNIVGDQYRCVCAGTVTGESTTKCAVNAILCPKLQRQSTP